MGRGGFFSTVGSGGGGGVVGRLYSGESGGISTTHPFRGIVFLNKIKKRKGQ
jgi:hypothetical protein